MFGLPTSMPAAHCLPHCAALLINVLVCQTPPALSSILIWPAGSSLFLFEMTSAGMYAVTVLWVLAVIVNCLGW